MKLVIICDKKNKTATLFGELNGKLELIEADLRISTSVPHISSQSDVLLYNVPIRDA